jgi:hypothetical protein
MHEMDGCGVRLCPIGVAGMTSFKFLTGTMMCRGEEGGCGSDRQIWRHEFRFSRSPLPIPRRIAFIVSTLILRESSRGGSGLRGRQVGSERGCRSSWSPHPGAPIASGWFGCRSRPPGGAWRTSVARCGSSPAWSASHRGRPGEPLSAPLTRPGDAVSFFPTGDLGSGKRRGQPAKSTRSPKAPPPWVFRLFTPLPLAAGFGRCAPTAFPPGWINLVVIWRVYIMVVATSRWPSSSSLSATASRRRTAATLPLLRPERS